MHRDAFIITKPLQFMVCATLIDTFGLADRADLLIVDAFAGADEFVSRYHGLGPEWGRLGLFENHSDAYRYVRRERRYSRMFIDSDFGVQKSIMLARQRIAQPGCKIIVYEEGVGTYRTDFYSPMKRELFHRLGIGAAFGGSKFTSGIFVYDVGDYRRKVGRLGGNATGIETKLMDFIDANSTALAHLFGVSDKYEHCADRAIYLTSWSTDRDFIAAASGRHENFLVKPHPHINNHEMLGVPQIDAGTPAEIVIPAIAAKTDVLTVYHHGSSAAHYLSKIPNIRWIQLKNPPLENRPIYEVV